MSPTLALALAMVTHRPHERWPQAICKIFLVYALIRIVYQLFAPPCRVPAAIPPSIADSWEPRHRTCASAKRYRWRAIGVPSHLATRPLAGSWQPGAPVPLGPIGRPARAPAGIRADMRVAPLPFREMPDKAWLFGPGWPRGGHGWAAGPPLRAAGAAAASGSGPRQGPRPGRRHPGLGRRSERHPATFSFAYEVIKTFKFTDLSIIGILRIARVNSAARIVRLY